ncbi:hypothetical protein TOPH_04102 [Tolypocladium ophioglossoides CBS 100239]|uniref:DUF6546 domain-containing protein n=1 Tax=Tolypocladium ophioglossoides (strain CBS 100239) TaxID=1163406 RepID=A0A0L0NAY6_TOLOC|nr:hypothetical protein TOPH_04102 [Tolypocladium ophioglossoides CBS 100239]
MIPCTVARRPNGGAINLVSRGDMGRQPFTFSPRTRSIGFFRASLGWRHWSTGRGSDIQVSHTYRPGRAWNDLEYLTLTSQFLDPEESQPRVNETLRLAGVSVVNMPKLDASEIWNGKHGMAGVFHFDTTGDSAVLSWRGTWDLVLN